MRADVARAGFHDPRRPTLQTHEWAKGDALAWSGDRAFFVVEVAYPGSCAVVERFAPVRPKSYDNNNTEGLWNPLEEIGEVRPGLTTLSARC